MLLGLRFRLGCCVLEAAMAPGTYLRLFPQRCFPVSRQRMGLKQGDGGCGVTPDACAGFAAKAPSAQPPEMGNTGV